MKTGPTVVSLFSGGGGLDLGLAAAGFSILYESDIDLVSCTTLRENGGKAAAFSMPGFEHTKVEQGDVRDLDGSDLISKLGYEVGGIDVLAGGPPCQAFSVFGKRRGTTDQRGQLSFEYRRLLSEIQPKVFVFENVAGLLTVEGGATYERLVAELSNPTDGLRYELFINRLNAQDFGVPQSRDRVIIIGIRDDIYLSSGQLNFEILPITSQSGSNTGLKWRTVRDGLRGLPDVGESSFNDRIPNHRGRKHSGRIIDRYNALAPGERDGKTRINRLDLDRPSYTIVVGSDAGGGKGHVHPTLPREVTPRESARMQTFPDWWAFDGSIRDEIRQVGNAVPALMSFAIGNEIRNQIFGLERVPFETGLQRLDQSHLFPEVKADFAAHI